MAPKDGKECTIIAPTAPKKADDADDADPGQIQQNKATARKLKAGKYGETEAPAFVPPPPPAAGGGAGGSDEPAKETVFVAIKMADETGKPLAGEPYQVTLPDGSVTSGTLDKNGCARVDGIDPGHCHVSFPNMQNDQWKPG